MSGGPSESIKAVSKLVREDRHHDSQMTGNPEVDRETAYRPRVVILAVFVPTDSQCLFLCSPGATTLGACWDCAASVVAHGACLAFANHMPKTSPSANAALATTGSHVAQICFSSLTRKSSICCARIVMLCRSESLALLVLATTPMSGCATSRSTFSNCF
jgi:hypothetical protein